MLASDSIIPTNGFPDFLLQGDVKQTNAQNSGNTETTFFLPSPTCLDYFFSDKISPCDVLDQLARYENCKTNKDLDLININMDSMEPDLHELVREINGRHVDSDEPDIPQPQSESCVPEKADSSDDSAVATINSKTRSKNHAPFEISDEFKQNNLTKTSFAFVQPKFGKQRNFIVAILQKSCSALIISLRGLPDYFRVKHSLYSRDNPKSLSFNRNDFGENRIVSFYLQSLKESYTNVEKIGCTLEFKFIFDDSEPIIVTLDELYVANHKYESGKKIKGQKRPVASTVFVTKSCVEIVNQFDIA